MSGYARVLKWQDTDLAKPHSVAIKPTGNVYTHDTIHRLNVKAKNWHDLISDEPFTRADIITLQDPQHLAARDMTNFKYLQDGASTLTEEQERERRDPTSGLNLNAMGSSAKVLRAKEAVARAREERKASNNPNMAPSRQKQPIHPANPPNPPPKRPQNTSHHTSGLAAASLTSTGLTPHTSTALTTLTEEEALLSKPRKVKHKGYARMTTTHGALNLELNAEYAPRATWNFLALAKRGYYDAVPFHRNIRNFMIQGGDPAGTGRGGESCWGKGKPFKDEWMHSPLSHDSRGVLSMANKGRDTNTSQFFVAYRPCRHLDRKHTIFGRVLLPGNDAGGEEVGAESEATLRRLEAVDASEADSRPLEDCAIDEVQVLIDPFDEHRRETAAREGEEREREEVRLAGGTEDDRTTWTGKRVRAEGGGRDVEDDGHGGGVGKYLGGAKPPGVGDEIVEEVLEEWEEARDTAQPPAKKRKAPGDFGNFDAW